MHKEVKKMTKVELRYASILDIYESNVLAKPDGIDGMASIPIEKFPTDRRIEIGDIYIWDMESNEVVFDMEETQARRAHVANLLAMLRKSSN